VSERLVSLDALRGVTIAGMVLVNDPGVGPPYLYRQLQHAPWNGWTFADTIFPCFLFMVGVSMGLASRPPAWSRVARRVVLLFALGLVVNAAGSVFAGSSAGSVLAHLRIMGVLQRIALAYLLAVMITMWWSPAKQPVIGAAILLAAWAALAWVPVPGAGDGHLTAGHNLEGWIDRHVFGSAHLYRMGSVGYDPEGLFGCLPAAVSVLIGVAAGRRVRAGGHGLVAWLAGWGAVLGIAGWAWGQVLPINKRLWTSSYVLLMGGICLGLLAFAHLLFDRWAPPLGRPAAVLGANAIVVYVATELTGTAMGTFHRGRVPVSYWLWATYLRPAFGGLNGAVAHATLILAIWWVVAYGLYRRRWLLRV